MNRPPLDDLATDDTQVRALLDVDEVPDAGVGHAPDPLQCPLRRNVISDEQDAWHCLVPVSVHKPAENGDNQLISDQEFTVVKSL